MPKCIIKYTTEKILEENLDDDFYKLGFSKAFWSIIAKPETIKKKIDKSDYTKIDTSSAKQQDTQIKKTNDRNFHLQLWTVKFNHIYSATENTSKIELKKKKPIWKHLTSKTTKACRIYILERTEKPWDELPSWPLSPHGICWFIRLRDQETKQRAVATDQRQ